MPRRRKKPEQPDENECGRKQRDQDPPVTLQPRTAGYSSSLFELGSKLDHHTLGDLDAERHTLDEQSDDQKVNRPVKKQENPGFKDSPQKRESHQDARNRPR